MPVRNGHEDECTFRVEKVKGHEETLPFLFALRHDLVLAVLEVDADNLGVCVVSE